MLTGTTPATLAAAYLVMTAFFLIYHQVDGSPPEAASEADVSRDCTDKGAVWNDTFHHPLTDRNLLCRESCPPIKPHHNSSYKSFCSNNCRNYSKCVVDAIIAPCMQHDQRAVTDVAIKPCSCHCFISINGEVCGDQSCSAIRSCYIAKGLGRFVDVVTTASVPTYNNTPLTTNVSKTSDVTPTTLEFGAISVNRAIVVIAITFIAVLVVLISVLCVIVYFKGLLCFDKRDKGHVRADDTDAEAVWRREGPNEDAQRVRLTASAGSTVHGGHSLSGLGSTDSVNYALRTGSATQLGTRVLTADRLNVPWGDSSRSLINLRTEFEEDTTTSCDASTLSGVS